jgi:glycosyltransferase involved in cell wall biosynthesis
MYKYSVIIPTYNRLLFLQKAINSVFEQNFSDFEIIVVDDGSSDGTWDWLQSQGSRVIALKQLNSGPGAARNLGASHARGDYLVFLDSDDVWFPWSIDTITHVIEQENRPAIIQTSCLYDDSPVGAEYESREIPSLSYLKYSNVYSYAAEQPVSGAGATVIRRDIWQETNGFPPGRIVGEDIHLMFQLGLHGSVVFIQSPPIFRYQKHEANTTGSAVAWFKGACVLLNSESRGEFPDNQNYRSNRRLWLAHDAGYRALQCLKLKRGQWLCIALYAKSFKLQWEVGNWGFLIKTPMRFALALIGLWPPKTKK